MSYCEKSWWAGKTLELENIAVRGDDGLGVKSPLFRASEPIMWLQVVTIKLLFR